MGLISLIFISITGFWANKIIEGLPINIQFSDIIPAIQIMVKRLFSGEYPYSPLTELGYTAPAGYMPLHWLPFSVADVFNFDYRFVPLVVFWIASLVVSIRAIRAGPLYFTISIALLTGAFFLIKSFEDGIISMTVELLIASYYMLFISGLNQRNKILEGAGIALCVLSRYSLLLWLPIWLFTYLLTRQIKKLAIVSATIFFFVLVIYIIPFLSKDWTLFSTTASSYAHLSWEWQHLNDQKQPIHLYNGVGFAHLFYEKYGGADYMSGFHLARKAFFIANACCILLLATWYWRIRKNLDQRIFLLYSFKIYLTVFFSFIMVPYVYLLATSVFVSITIWSEQSRYRYSQKKSHLPAALNDN